MVKEPSWKTGKLSSNPDQSSGLDSALVVSTVTHWLRTGGFNYCYTFFIRNSFCDFPGMPVSKKFKAEKYQTVFGASAT